MTAKHKRLRLARAKRFGDLDSLLSEALKAELNNRRGRGTVTRLNLIQESLHQSFANPQNWKDLGTVVVMYADDATGEQTTVGLFRDLEHIRTGARKLLRVTVDSPEIYSVAARTEVFRDPYLVRPRVDPCPAALPANAFERQAIRDYLARQKEQKQDLGEFLGSKADAAKLLKELHELKLSAEV